MFSVKSRLLIATCTAIICLAVPASAFAQSLSSDVYSSQGGQVLATAESGETAPTTTTAATAPTTAAVNESGAGTLPFTGFEAGIVGLVGIMLLGSGLLLWRVNRSPRKTGV